MIPALAPCTLKVQTTSLTRARDAADNYLTTSVQPGDRVALYTSSGQKQVDFTDDKGKPSSNFVRAPCATGQHLRRITMKTLFDVKPGTYLVRAVVRGSESGQISGLNRTVEIPYSEVNLCFDINCF